MVVNLKVTKAYIWMLHLRLDWIASGLGYFLHVTITTRTFGVARFVILKQTEQHTNL